MRASTGTQVGRRATLRIHCSRPARPISRRCAGTALRPVRRGLRPRVGCAASRDDEKSAGTTTTTNLDAMLGDEGREEAAGKAPESGGAASNQDSAAPSKKEGPVFKGRRSGRVSLAEPGSYDPDAIPDEYKVMPTLGGQEAGETIRSDNIVLVTIAATLTTACLIGVNLMTGESLLDDLIYGEDGLGGAWEGLLDGFGIPQFLGAAMWAVSLWFISPLQILLLFLGRVDVERPSDWVLGKLGRAAGLDVDDVGYVPPGNIKAGAYALFVLGGLGMSVGINALVQDATWGLSTGIGSLMAAGVYEVGRPRRVEGEEAVALENQYQDFCRFADKFLEQSGQCHESDVFVLFRREFPRYRDADSSELPDKVLRQMVRSWHPGSQRTSTGFLKGVSVKPVVDPFTGKAARGSRGA
ncbi:unnamed protein product [Pedinophyceae sp. YPF-701]|nr:unnamed protein product [Pedinophyceae sp. YPF-701]